jgi:hypothetical protein
MGEMPGWVGVLMMATILIIAYLIETKDDTTKQSKEEIEDANRFGVMLGRVQMRGATFLCVLALVFVTYIESAFLWKLSATPSIAFGFLIGVLVIDGARFFLPRSLIGGSPSHSLRIVLGRILVLFCILTSMFITAAYAFIYVYPDDVYVETAPGHRAIKEIDREIEKKSQRVPSKVWFDSNACNDESWRECMPVIMLREERRLAVASESAPLRRAIPRALDNPNLQGVVRALLIVVLSWISILISTLLPVVVQQAWEHAGKGQPPAPKPS